FLAEDGIRGFHVTGVQTCALPILGAQWSWLTLDGLRHLILPALNLSLFKISLVIRLTRAGVREVLPLDYVKFARAKGLSPLRVRSEERRVGKEPRCRCYVSTEIKQ